MAQTLEFGGLRFTASFDHRGATLCVFGLVEGQWTEMLRFDDFVDEPHFHAPSPPAGKQIPFDRATLGEPLAWFVMQIRDHLADWIERAGYPGVLDSIDLDEISRNVDRLTDAMVACVPEGFTRVPGIGVQRVNASA
jgi:hypothetical protein